MGRPPVQPFLVAISLVVSLAALVLTVSGRARPGVRVDWSERDRLSIERDTLLVDVVRDRTVIRKAMDAARPRQELVSIPSGSDGNPKRTTMEYDNVGRLMKVIEHAAYDIDVLVDDVGGPQILQLTEASSTFDRTLTTRYYLDSERAPVLITQVRSDSAEDGERRWYFLAGEFVTYRDDRPAPVVTQYRYLPDTPGDIAELRDDLTDALTRFDARNERGDG